jgi:ABC-type nitrate/sulfonate/bicarbonate transport system permease component
VVELARHGPGRADGDDVRRAAAHHAAALIDPLVGVALVLGLLELLSRADVLSRSWFPPVSEIFGSFVRLLAKHDFWAALLQTLQSWSLAVAVDVGAGIVLGVAIGSSELVHRGLRPVIEFMRPLPSVALIPFVVLTMGRTVTMKVLVVVLGSMWPMLLQTYYGVRDVDPVAVDTARAYGLGRRGILVRVTLPSMVPYLATGLRITASLALLIDVITELVGGGAGLGNQISAYQQGGATVTMYAYMLSVGLLGWAINIVLSSAERYALAWRPVRAVVAR